MEKRTKMKRIKQIFSFALLLPVLSTPAAIAQEDSAIELFSNSILDLNLLQTPNNSSIHDEIEIGKTNDADPTVPPEDILGIMQNDLNPIDTENTAENLPSSTSSNDSILEIPEDPENTTSVVLQNRDTLSENSTSTDFWLNFRDNNSTIEKKEGALITTLRSWFKQFFSFRNTESNPSVLHINDLHTVTSKNSVWIGWQTNNLAYSRIYYSTSTPLEVESSTIVPTEQGQTSVTVKPLLENTQYYYRVLAEDAYGNSTVSNELSFKTK